MAEDSAQNSAKSAGTNSEGGSKAGRTSVSTTSEAAPHPPQESAERRDTLESAATRKLKKDSDIDPVHVTQESPAMRIHEPAVASNNKAGVDQGQLDALRLQVESLKAGNEQLRDNLNAVMTTERDEDPSHSIAVLRSERDRLKREVSQHIDTEFELRERLTGMETHLDEALAALEREIEAHTRTKRRNKKLETALKQTKKRAAGAPGVRSEDPKLIEKVRASLESVLTTVADRDVLREEAGEARSSLEAADVEAKTVDAELHELGNTLGSTRNAFANAIRRVEDAETESATVHATPQALQNEIRQVESRLSELITNFSTVRGQLEALFEGFREVMTQPVRHQNALTSARTYLEARDSDVAELRKHVELQRRRLDNVRENIESATRADEGLQGEVARRDAAVWGDIQQLVKLLVELIGDDTMARDTLTGPMPGPQTAPAVVPVPEPRQFSRDAEGMTSPRLLDASLGPVRQLSLLLDVSPARSAAPVAGMEIDSRAAMLASRIDGQRTFRELLEDSGLPGREAAAILVDLLTAGHITI